VEHIERVLKTLNYKQVDRVPIDFGAGVSGMHYEFLKKLLKFMGFNYSTVEIAHRWTGTAKVPEFLLKHFEVDFRHVGLNPPTLSEVQYISEDVFIDEFGIVFKRCGHYYDMIEEKKPLYHAKSVADVEKYKPPRPVDERFRDLRKQARKYYEEGYAVVLDSFSGGIWELAQWLHGISNAMKNLILNPELMEAILDLTLEIHKTFWERMLQEAGDYVHIVLYTDDYGVQTGPQIPPRLWEKFIFPRLRDLISFIKSNAKVRVMLHSCGGIRPLIDGIIRAGVDILNPIQPRAKGMNRKELSKEYGGKIIFHGGLDVQEILPKASPEIIEKEVKDIINTFKRGYIFAPAHCVQPDVPPQNILMALRTALTYNP